MKLPHGRELITFLPLMELYTVYQDHERLTVFANKGLECVTCPRVGTFLIMSRETSANKQSRKRGSIGRIHLDIYTDDFVLMTVDHITPKSVAREMGWRESEIEALDNKQPMCDYCNGGKGCKLITNEQLKQNRSRANNSLVMPDSIAKMLVPNIHAMLGDTYEVAV